MIFAEVCSHAGKNTKDLGNKPDVLSICSAICLEAKNYIVKEWVEFVKKKNVFSYFVLKKLIRGLVEANASIMFL